MGQFGLNSLHAATNKTGGELESFYYTHPLKIVCVNKAGSDGASVKKQRNTHFISVTESIKNRREMEEVKRHEKKQVHLFYSVDCEDLARKVAAHSQALITLQTINWRFSSFLQLNIYVYVFNYVIFNFILFSGSPLFARKG